MRFASGDDTPRPGGYRQVNGETVPTGDRARSGDGTAPTGGKLLSGDDPAPTGGKLSTDAPFPTG
ncbi:hypothetical protein [Cytobacillus sp. IB215665]|uniref:hypothetical protein n=1 Tax=Cytobacillus sp. IB215665 TaxID=3097357 RepID=UPI002A0E607F|nr:hypothetical protein [Cytobacillus sp. IB215665]MDX8367136.1 hypothetical protein [Cytobacillus sp. IB215665]